MPTLYVENVPADLYEALKTRAKARGRSISAEVMDLLIQQVPTPDELARRRRVFDVARRIRNAGSASHTIPTSESAEAALREDRDR